MAPTGGRGKGVGEDDAGHHQGIYIRQLGKEWSVRLTSGVQTFSVGPEFDTKEEAEWFANKFRIAINRMNNPGELTTREARKHWRECAQSAPIIAMASDEVIRLCDHVDQLEDNPDFDCSDAAHPAWWRGHEHTAKVFCQLVNDILDGKDDGGGANYSPWGETRRRVLGFRNALVEWRKWYREHRPYKTRVQLENLTEGLLQ